MAQAQDIYGEINSETDMREVFGDIRKEVENASSRAALTELYRRAGYLITLTYAPTWQKKFGSDEAAALRAVGEQQFSKTASAINARAGQIGTDADYDETWGDKG